MYVMRKCLEPRPVVAAAIVLAVLCSGLTAPAAGVVLTGRVLQGQTGKPLAGARVFSTQTGEETVTDSLGLYWLETTARGRCVVRADGGDSLMEAGFMIPDTGDVFEWDFRLLRPVITFLDDGPFRQAQHDSSRAARREPESPSRIVRPIVTDSGWGSSVRSLDRRAHRALVLILEMSAQRDRELLRRSLDWTCNASRIIGASPYHINNLGWPEGRPRRVSQRDIRAFGWDYALDRVPGIVGR
jgi:hypothetical protein